MKKQLFKSLRPNSRTPIIAVTQYQFNDRISNACFAVGLLLTVFCFFLVWRNYSQLPPQVPLFLQRPWGNEQLAPKSWLWLQPGLLLLFFLVNYALSLITMKNEPLTARILGGTVLICSVMSIISLWNIMNLIVMVKIWF
ncbi:MAG: hypothetical protein M3Q44_02455 [bacterium]|nr:hypothetical protein [bacterium]